jgi:hypothetical protein
LFVAQSHHGYPRITQDGVGPHDLSVILDVPNSDWSTLFKPWDVPMLLLDVQHGFAARWWTMSIVLLVGAYLLLLALTGSLGIAVLFSLGLWLSPFFHWWYTSIALDSVGMGMMALGAFLFALRATNVLRRTAWLALTAYATIGFALLFYPPFQVPVALVIAAVGIFEVAGRLKERSVSWRTIAVCGGAAVAAVGVVLLAFYLHSRSTIAAVNGTIYPSHRHEAGGHTSLLQLFSAPFGLSLASNGAALTGDTNQSEISSFLLLGPFALLQLSRMRFRDLQTRWRLLIAGTAAVFALLSVWYLVSLPSFLAAVLQLDRVRAGRSIVGVGTAGILLMALFVAARFHPGQHPEARHGSNRLVDDNERRVTTGALVCGVVAFVMYFWGGRDLLTELPSLHLSLYAAALAAGAAGLVVLLTSARNVIVGGTALVVLGGFVSLSANPLYRGLGPLTSSPMLATFSREALHPPDRSHTTWVSFAGTYVTDVMIASGVPALNAIDGYPVAKSWEVLDPERRASAIWNRYANVAFAPAPPGAPPKLTLVQEDVVDVSFDPCGTAAGNLGVGFFVSQAPLADTCLRLLTTTASDGTQVDIYARVGTQLPAAPAGTRAADGAVLG